jgi:hypothetical protein
VRGEGKARKIAVPVSLLEGELVLFGSFVAEKEKRIMVSLESLCRSRRIKTYTHS